MEVAEMTRSIERRGLLVLALGLAALLAPPLTAVAQTLPDYSASAGMLNIGKDPERPDAEIFHVAYALKGADPATRPVTFVFNGGPGAASIYLHLSAIGPKTIVTAGDGSFPAVPARLEENPDSWITFTDLVFIDPVGTGYSRMLPGPDGQPGDPKPYYSVDGDVDAIAGFIRQWLTVNKRWGSPKAIAGESYAGQRIAALSRVLAEQYGINLNRAVLISPAFNVPTLEDTHAYDLLHPIILLPTQAAVAAYHRKSTVKNDAAGRKAAEDYALTGYLTGLATLGQASAEEQAAFHAKVGGLIGLDPALVARHRSRVPETVFAIELLAAQGKVLDNFDGTQASDNPTPEMRDDVGVAPPRSTSSPACSCRPSSTTSREIWAMSPSGPITCSAWRWGRCGTASRSWAPRRIWRSRSRRIPTSRPSWSMAITTWASPTFCRVTCWSK
jgi:carboxypeptidase C (cathepsin A)